MQDGRFTDFDKIEDASIKDLEGIKGISRKTAEILKGNADRYFEKRYKLELYGEIVLNDEKRRNAILGMATDLYKDIIVGNYGKYNNTSKEVFEYSLKKARDFYSNLEMECGLY